jgi:Ca-activated chloride channel family protein
MLTFSYPWIVIWIILILSLYIIVQYRIPVDFFRTHSSDASVATKLWRRGYLMILMVVSIGLLLAGPTRRTSYQEDSRTARAFVVVLDISYSMYADDITPNRIESAKNSLVEVLGTMDGDQIGIVLFAGQPVAAVPMTSDISAIQSLIQSYTPDSIDQSQRWMQGTAIWDALLAWLTMLWVKGDKPSDYNASNKAMILLTDGDANVGIDPQQIAQYASTRDIPIYTIGIGSQAWWSIPMQTAFGVRRQAVDPLNESTLTNIATITDGFYTRVDSASTFAQALDRITAINPWTVITQTQYHHSDLWIVLLSILWLSIILLLYDAIRKGYHIHILLFSTISHAVSRLRFSRSKA